jgi:hypothetical protein
VSVYSQAQLCAAADRALAQRGDEVEGVEVKLVCLDAGEVRQGRLDLAAIGAGARQAVEDSTSIAYLQLPGPASSFSEPILDEAEIPTITGHSGSRSMTEVLNALDARSSNESPRAAVWDVR